MTGVFLKEAEQRKQCIRGKKPEVQKSQSQEDKYYYTFQTRPMEIILGVTTSSSEETQ